MQNRLMEVVEKATLKPTIPKFEIGDTVDVHVRILEGDKERIQIYNGVVIARSGAGPREMFVVRRIVQGEGVERKFPLHSPRIADIVVKRSGKVRRAKLYYLRSFRARPSASRSGSPARRPRPRPRPPRPSAGKPEPPRKRRPRADGSVAYLNRLIPPGLILIDASTWSSERRRSWSVAAVPSKKSPQTLLTLPLREALSFAMGVTDGGFGRP